MPGEQVEFPDELPNWFPRYDREASDYVAAIVLAADILAVAVADVTAAGQEIAPRDGEEIPESTIVIETMETTVRTDGGREGMESAADDLLAANGWRRTGPWEHEDDTASATVERA